MLKEKLQSLGLEVSQDCGFFDLGNVKAHDFLISKVSIEKYKVIVMGVHNNKTLLAKLSGMLDNEWDVVLHPKHDPFSNYYYISFRTYS